MGGGARPPLSTSEYSGPGSGARRWRPASGVRYVYEADKEENGEEIEQPVLTPEFSAEDVNAGICDNAEAKPVCDRRAERNHDQREEGGDGRERLGPGDLGDGSQHEAADDDERRGCRCGWHDADERRGEEGDEEPQASDDGGDAGASSDGHACCRLDVTGDRGCSG